MGSKVMNISPDKDDYIVIHVCDEGRRIERDFTCHKNTLLREMRYFESYLTGSHSSEDIDISVHCDVHIFDWLVQYMHKDGTAPKLDSNSVISILISSEFLQMHNLVNKCLQYTHDAISEIIALPIDLNCIGDSLLEPLSKLFTLEEIIKIKDPRDKLTSRILMKHLETLLNEHEGNIIMCEYCKKLCPSNDVKYLTCLKAPALVRLNGKISAMHRADNSWNIKQHLQTLRSKMKLSWRDIYWRIWGASHTVYCKVCEERVIVSDLNNCSFHLKAPVIENGMNEGYYPCCGGFTSRFGTKLKPQGCTFKLHSMDYKAEDPKVVAILKFAGDLVYIPAEIPSDASGTSSNKTQSKNQKASVFMQMSKDPNQHSKQSPFENKTSYYVDSGPSSDWANAVDSKGDGSSSDDDGPRLVSPAEKSFSRLKSRKSPTLTLSNTANAVSRRRNKDESTRESDTERTKMLLSHLKSLRSQSNVNPSSEESSRPKTAA